MCLKKFPLVHLTTHQQAEQSKPHQGAKTIKVHLRQMHISLLSDNFCRKALAIIFEKTTFIP